MAPTDCGFLVWDRLKLKPLCAEIDMAQADIRAFAQGRNYQLRIGSIGLAASKFLNPALSELKRTFPKLKLLLIDQSPFSNWKGCGTEALAWP